jgi:hypothetical protein
VSIKGDKEVKISNWNWLLVLRIFFSLVFTLINHLHAGDKKIISTYTVPHRMLVSVSHSHCLDCDERESEIEKNKQNEQKVGLINNLLSIASRAE